MFTVYEVRVYNSTGDIIWTQDGVIHRLGGLPAIEHGDGFKAWLEYGKYHNLNGPAVINPQSGWKEWYIEGTKYSENKYHERIKEIKDLEAVRKQFSPVVVSTIEIDGKKYKLIPVD